MKQIFFRYSHWLAFFFLSLSFVTMFDNFEKDTADIVAAVMGAIGLVSVGFLTFIVEKNIRKKRKDKNNKV
ncbi:hypothetical protein [Alkalihalobacillus sp. BA299]|uniref:hypothetical protein n=1 Tax=Alkalihalobacillus sp. BA299 TaxID=2815938 RepID=UPI001ADA40AB|nr:hypothetical protein [Alkalihalobacillus sp. BA299]